MAKKRKTLPKDFAEILKSGDPAAMKAVFDICELDARGSHAKQVALAYVECPDDLARWLVGQGADLEAPDQYGRSPIQSRAGHWQGDVSVLLELGASASGATGTDTPLHLAANVHNLRAMRDLMANGASAELRNRQGLTPLGSALQQCSNAKLETMAQVAEFLLAEGARQPRRGLFARLTGKGGTSEADDPALKAMVTRLGETFEFHRADFNPETRDAASAALDRLYDLFSVPPVARRQLHPLDAPILVGSGTWQEHHSELWQRLVPGKGAAPTVQGEVIRISGRISDEIDGNGGINWDSDYARMADAIVNHFASGTALPEAELARAREIAADAKRKRGNSALLAELAVEWVRRNPTPIVLNRPDYDR